MADETQLATLRQGVKLWNTWRAEHHNIAPNLSTADLRGVNLRGADLTKAYLYRAVFHDADLSDANLSAAYLREADLSNANLSRALLNQADLRGADLSRANLREASLHQAALIEAHMSWANLREANLNDALLSGADLSGAILSRATLREARLSGARLQEADLHGADLRGLDLRGLDLSGADLSEADLRWAVLTAADLSRANLRYAILVKTQLESAIIADCAVYGVSAWSLNLERATQTNLSINDDDEPTITVDNLEVAQFIHLMLHNQKIRYIIDALTSKVVLILGRFKPQRKAVLDALREELRKYNYVPVLFDFAGPSERNLTETVTLLARMARFIIADLTEPSSIPHELQSFVPHVAVPLRPLIVKQKRPFAMFQDYYLYPWTLPVYEYTNSEQLIASLYDQIIAPAEAKAIELYKLRHPEPVDASGGRVELRTRSRGQRQ